MKSGCSGAGDWHANINQEGWRGTSVLKNRFIGRFRLGMGGHAAGKR